MFKLFARLCYEKADYFKPAAGTDDWLDDLWPSTGSDLDTSDSVSSFSALYSVDVTNQTQHPNAHSRTGALVYEGSAYDGHSAKEIGKLFIDLVSNFKLD